MTAFEVIEVKLLFELLVGLFGKRSIAPTFRS